MLLGGEARDVALRLPDELEHLDGAEPEELLVGYPLPRRGLAVDAQGGIRGLGAGRRRRARDPRGQEALACVQPEAPLQLIRPA